MLTDHEIHLERKRNKLKSKIALKKENEKNIEDILKDPETKLTYIQAHGYLKTYSKLNEYITRHYAISKFRLCLKFFKYKIYHFSFLIFLFSSSILCLILMFHESINIFLLPIYVMICVVFMVFSLIFFLALLFD